VRPYRELVSDDPAWPEIAALAAQRPAHIRVLPCDPAAARTCLEALQVTTRSSLGALAHETGGILSITGGCACLARAIRACSARSGLEP
jgi:hypothetical protein